MGKIAKKKFQTVMCHTTLSKDIMEPLYVELPKPVYIPKEEVEKCKIGSDFHYLIMKYVAEAWEKDHKYLEKYKDRDRKRRRALAKAAKRQGL